MANDERPALWWDPGWLQSSAPMTGEGEIPGSPFANLDTALDAVRRRRAANAGDASPRDNVYLVTYAPRRWVVFEYSERNLSRADLSEIAPRGLPLGGDITDPRTFIVDGQGRLGKLVGHWDPVAYEIREVDQSFQAPGPPAAFVAAVVPAPLTNHGGHVAWNPRITLRPAAKIDELAESLEALHRSLPQDVGMKAGGRRHSWSHAAATDGVYIHPELMRGVEVVAGRPSAALLKAGVSQDVLFHVLAGSQISHINKKLWASDRALAALGGYDGQTLGGVLPTGTHGSVLKRGPLAEMVKSLDLVRFDGKKVRIEPATGGITDPAKFAAGRPTWILEQDDDVFNAVLISMGTMGVAFSFIIESVERYWLKEIRTLTTMPQVKSAVERGNIYHLMEVTNVPGWVAASDTRAFKDHPKPAYHMEFLWNPYTDTVVITTRHPVEASERQKLEHDEPAWFDNPPTRSLFRALKLDAMGEDYSRPDLNELATEHFSGSLDEVVEFIAKTRPQLLPGFIDVGLKGLEDDSYIQRSYNVFNIGQGANMIPAQSSTISVPLRDDLWLDAIDVLRDVARREASANDLYETGPISLRFVRGSDIMLADHEDVCKFEIIFGGDSKQINTATHDLVRAYYTDLYRKLGSDVHFHWGQVIPDRTVEVPGSTGRHRLRASYARYDEWRSIRDRFDPTGRGLNAWQKSILP